MKKVKMDKLKPPFRILTKVGPSRLYLQSWCIGQLDDAEREFAKCLDTVCKTVYNSRSASLDVPLNIRISLLSGKTGKGIKVHEMQVYSVNDSYNPVCVDVIGESKSEASRLLRRLNVDLSASHLSEPAERVDVPLTDELLSTTGHFVIRVGHNSMELHNSSLADAKDAFLLELRRAINNRKRHPSTDLYMSCSHRCGGVVTMLSEVVVHGIQLQKEVAGLDGFEEMPWGCWELKPLQEVSGEKDGVRVHEPEPELEKEPVKEACAAETPESVKLKTYEVDIDRMSRISASADRIISMCDSIKMMLLDKNRKYGDSALAPKRVFSKADPVEQLKVRIDDKLSRIQSGQEDEDEDVYKDLVGYLVLLMIALKDSK